MADSTPPPARLILSPMPSHRIPPLMGWTATLSPSSLMWLLVIRQWLAQRQLLQCQGAKTIAWRRALLLPQRPFGASGICFWHSSMLFIECCIPCIPIVVQWFGKQMLGRPTSFGCWMSLSWGSSSSSFLYSRSLSAYFLNSRAPICASRPS